MLIIGGYRICINVIEDEKQTAIEISLAVNLYQDEAVSLGKAAKLANLSTEEFMEMLGAKEIPCISYDPDDLDREVASFS